MWMSGVCRLLQLSGFSVLRRVDVGYMVNALSQTGIAMQKLGGSIHVDTAQGVGTSFTLTIPLSASLLRCLLVSVEDHTFAIPERQILHVAEIEADEIEPIGENQFCAYRDLMIPVHALGRLLGLAVSERHAGRARLVIVSTQTQPVALEVDRILRFQDLFLKELHPVLAEVPAISGASVLGDGRPVLVLDMEGLTNVNVSQAEVPASSPTLQA
jgi:chemotaxis protein histidine kinase CheA